MQFGSIKQEKLRSPLGGLAQVRPTSSMGHVMRGAAPLMLTSLVDAFAVIVIYLLITTQQSGKDLKIDQEIKLPQAHNSKVLEPGVNVQVRNNRYIIDDQEMNAGQLLSHLKSLHEGLKAQGDEKLGKIVIQADKSSDYSGISPILSVAAQSGFDNIKFAVIGE